VRETRGVVKGLFSTRHPLLVHIIPTRRCNLACTYCNEFDDFSKPVDTAEMIRRIDRLGNSARPSSRSAAANRSCIRNST
jgi:MoaA/NifB/PqqE/SkfB family radical SAM enzyme